MAHGVGVDIDADTLLATGFPGAKSQPSGDHQRLPLRDRSRDVFGESPESGDVVPVRSIVDPGAGRAIEAPLRAPEPKVHDRETSGRDLELRVSRDISHNGDGVVHFSLSRPDRFRAALVPECPSGTSDEIRLADRHDP